MQHPTRHHDDDALVSTTEAARLLSCSESAIRGYCNAGVVHPMRVAGKRILRHADIDTLRRHRAAIAERRKLTD